MTPKQVPPLSFCFEEYAAEKTKYYGLKISTVQSLASVLACFDGI